MDERVGSGATTAPRAHERARERPPTGREDERERALRAAQHRRMREDCGVPAVPHPAWYPHAGRICLPPEHIPLLDDVGAIERRWSHAQSRFVDDPLAALSGAQCVLEQLIRELDHALHCEREALARRWSAEEPLSTEELRYAMRCYGALIERLLTV